MIKFRDCLLGLCSILAMQGTAHAQQDSIAYRVILVGDAGNPRNGKQPELELLRSVFNLNDGHTSLVYLGDNIYPSGMPDPHDATFEAAKKIIDEQVQVVEHTKTPAYFIPGNYDWKQGKPDGWSQVIHEYDYIESLQLPNVHFVPRKGCPGPEAISLSDSVTLIVMDSQWWLHRYAKPGITSDCECSSEDQVLTTLKDLLYQNRNKLVLFATHHPFKTYGKHGGYFTLKQHIFPFTDLNPNLWIPMPIVGSMYPIGRRWFGNIQDVHHPLYKKMIEDVDAILNDHPNCIRVASHDHSLQLIRENNNDYIVSGSGSRAGRVKKDGKNSAFASPESGFAVIELTRSGKVWVKFYSSTNAVASVPLYTSEALAFNPEREKEDARVAIANLPDSVTAIADPNYKAGAYKKWFLGSNYRNEWTQPLRVRVLDIGKELGGLKPIQRGGGHQSKSLRLEDSAGRQYVLRSIEKYPDQALPPDLRETFAKDLVKDGISASYPYASLSIPALASVAGIPHATPQLVYVPDDPRLKEYRFDFANSLCLLEEREPADKSYTTEKIYDKLEEDHDNQVDQQAVLHARLLDMFIMDFDRHEDQWRWGIKKEGKGETYFPIPRDRDQAFFINTGFLPRMISRPWIAPQLQGFKKKATNINTFNATPRNFDRNFLNGLNEEDWKKQTELLLGEMSDSVIESAIKSQPPEIFPISGNKIIETLKARRQYLMKEAMEYYRFLAREVDVAGSDKKELFDIDRAQNGIVHVTIYALNKNGESGAKLYDRIFTRHDTREIRLYGMGGEDRFELHGDASKTIKVRIIGGSGNDLFDNEAAHAGAAKTVIYDVTTEQNQFTGKENETRKLSPNAAVNDLNRMAFKYDVMAPFIAAAYNIDDGVYLGAAVKYTTHAFRKEPFSVQQRLSIAHSLETKAYNFKYALEAIDVINKMDLVLLADIRAPNNTINFFRYGNETVFDRSGGKDIRYYRTRFSLADLVVLSRFNIASNTTLSIGPFFQRFAMNIKDNNGRLITKPFLNGLDSVSLFKQKNFGGIQVSTLVDNRNNAILPSRGIIWQTTLRVNQGFGSFSNNCTQLNTDLAMFFSFNTQANLVIATRFGGGINFGNYEFFQAQYLSGTENLRGYRKYRFAGDKAAFNNTELRIKLADFRTYLLPGNLGIILFHDIGRVWVKGEDSHVWHTGYGGGIWVSPLRRFVGTACYGFSKDGGLPFVSLGFQF